MTRRTSRPGRPGESGAVFIEYLQVLFVVTLGLMAATVPVGILVVHYWDVIDVMIGLPFP